MNLWIESQFMCTLCLLHNSSPTAQAVTRDMSRYGFMTCLFSACLWLSAIGIDVHTPTLIGISIISISFLHYFCINHYHTFFLIWSFAWINFVKTFGKLSLSYAHFMLFCSFYAQDLCSYRKENILGISTTLL